MHAIDDNKPPSSPRGRTCVTCVLPSADGAQATIDDLHSEGKRVVCYISIGTVENWRVDAGDFPDEAIGSPMGDWGGERWLDITNEVELRVPCLLKT